MKLLQPDSESGGRLRLAEVIGRSEIDRIAFLLIQKLSVSTLMSFSGAAQDPWVLDLSSATFPEW